MVKLVFVTEDDQPMGWDEIAFWLSILDAARTSSQEQNRAAWHEVESSSGYGGSLGGIKKATSLVELTQAAYDTLDKQRAELFAEVIRRVREVFHLDDLWARFIKIGSDCGLTLIEDQYGFENLFDEVLRESHGRGRAFELRLEDRRVGYLQLILSRKGSEPAEPIKVHIHPDRTHDWQDPEFRATEEYKFLFQFQVNLQEAGFSIWLELKPPVEQTPQEELLGDGAVRTVIG